MEIIITINQVEDVVNKIREKVNFTHSISQSTVERYIVSQKNIFTCENLSLETINTWDIVKSAFDSGNELLGGWLNDETGIYYLDYNKSIHDLNKATTVARNNNQLAIYDNMTKQVIKIV